MGEFFSTILSLFLKNLVALQQRLANACWDALVERNLVKEFLGTSLRDLQAPRDLLFYLAAFSHLGIPFFEAVKRYPELLFWPGQWRDDKAETHPHT